MIPHVLVVAYFCSPSQVRGEAVKFDYGPTGGVSRFYAICECVTGFEWQRAGTASIGVLKFGESYGEQS